MNLISYFIDHECEATDIQLMTKPDVSAAEVAFDCLAMFGSLPRTVSIGVPGNVVWTKPVEREVPGL